MGICDGNIMRIQKQLAFYFEIKKQRILPNMAISVWHIFAASVDFIEKSKLIVDVEKHEKS